jgi:ribosomal silencing factor RsfS
VDASLGKKRRVNKTPYRWEKLGMVVHMCHPSYRKKCKMEELWSSPAQTKSKTLSQKINNRAKRAGVMT